ncbi:MAG: hypothetical protein IPJ19_00725 [Planctomycetes bacterium]|nr:hypothetical protein [Planctomycetota bacterium]
MKLFHTLASAGALAAVANSAFAQVIEIEPNDSKATATPALGLTSGMFLDGLSTSATGTGLDYWRVGTAPAAPGIYRHELVITTTGGVGHTGYIRGLNQTSGVTGVCPANGTAPVAGTTDSAVQTSSTASTPPRMNAWYGFGKGESIYYEVTGAAATTANYHSTLTSTPVVPIVVPGTFAAGPITLTTTGQTTADTDIALFDSNFNVVINAEGPATNDDEHCHPGTTLESWLTRTLPAGTYYLAVGGYNTCTNLPSPTDEDFMTGLILDLPDSLACSSTLVSSDRDFQITDGQNTYTSSGVLTTKYFDVIWVQFTVGGGAVAYCDPGTAGVSACPCSNPPSGSLRGCNNSAATGGASLAASGNSNLASDTLTLASSNQTPNGTTIMLQGTSSNGTGVAFGQGIRCIAGTLKRLYVKSPGGAGGITVPGAGDPTVSARSAALGDVITAGQHRYYMAYYRDPVVLGGCVGTSTYNATNSMDVPWN